MLGWLAAAIFAGLLFGHGSDPDWVQVYAQVRPSVLPLQTLTESGRETICSATIIDAKLPLFVSATHCRTPGVQQFVDDIPFRVIYQEGDLMALVTLGRHHRWRSIAIRNDYPRTGEEVAALGYAAKGERPSILSGIIGNRADIRLDAYFREAGVPLLPLAGIYFNLDLWHGVSGGPIVDTRGRLLAISSLSGKIDNSPAAVTISARPDLVRAFIEKALKVAVEAPIGFRHSTSHF